MSDIILRAENLSKHFAAGHGFLARGERHVRAVDDVSFELRRREVLGLVGESGCGKSTTGRLVMRLIEPTSGRVFFDGAEITALDKPALRALRRKLQIVFQDPYSSLNPRLTVRRIVGEPLVIHELCARSELGDRVAELLRKVGLLPDHMRRYPHELSGGQRQRVGIARALIVNPELIVADEPVSALDVSIQAQVLNLLEDLKDEFRLSLIMISHNMSVIQHACDRVAVMYLGQLVEVAGADEIVIAPCHPYTEALVSAVPVPDPHAHRSRIILKGDVPSPIDPPAGCRFHTRCPHARAQCAVEQPQLREVRPSHWAACHFAEQIYGSA
jgi:oligopeptide/dipeptide ABC transporter ATP-binding protein